MSSYFKRSLRAFATGLALVLLTGAPSVNALSPEQYVGTVWSRACLPNSLEEDAHKYIVIKAKQLCEYRKLTGDVCHDVTWKPLPGDRFAAKVKDIGTFHFGIEDNVKLTLYTVETKTPRKMDVLGAAALSKGPNPKLSCPPKSRAAHSDFKRPPRPEEVTAIDTLVRTKSPGARKMLAWVRHDRAVELVSAYHKKGDLADLEVGIKYARSATELNPGQIRFWKVLAMAALSFPKGDLTPFVAENALLHILKLSPEDRVARKQLIDLYVGTEQFGDAIDHYFHLLKTKPLGEPDFDVVKMAYACIEAGEEGRCAIDLFEFADSRESEIREKGGDMRDFPFETSVAMMILMRAQHLEQWNRDFISMLTDPDNEDSRYIPSHVRKLALELNDYWEKKGPMADAPEVEEWP